MLRILTLSDPHWTHHRGGVAAYVDQYGLPDIGTYDVVVITGDIDNPVMSSIADVARLYARGGKPVIYVEGNHDFYRGLPGRPFEFTFFEEQHGMLKEFCAQNGISLLASDTGPIVIDNVRFAGCTNWSEIPPELVPAGMSKTDAMYYSQNGRHRDSERMFERGSPHNDFREIRVGEGNSAHRFTPSLMLKWAAEQHAFLESVLSTPHDGPTVLATHVGPASIVAPGMHAWLYGSRRAEDLAIQYGVDLWLHGHTHRSHDLDIGGVRVVSNSRGYPGENPRFDPRLVIEVGQPKPTPAFGV